MRVHEVMTTTVKTVGPEVPLKTAAAAMIEHGISGLPVCETDGRVLGIVSEADILYKERGPEQQRGPLSWFFDLPALETIAKTSARTAGEAMTAPAITIRPDATVGEAARVMGDRGVNRLPVTEADGILVGIVTRADLVRAFTRPDDAVAAEIRHVVQHELWVPLEYVSVEVEAGEVTLTGELDTRTEAELVEAFARRVPGVVAVESQLTWRVDDLSRRALAQQVPRVV